MATVLEQTTTRLVVRTSYLATRIISVLVIIALIGIAGGVRALGSPIFWLVGALFGGLLLFLNWFWQPITITIDQAEDRFLVRYGGLFGLGARSRELRLTDVSAVAAPFVIGRGSRIEVKLVSGERFALTHNYATSDAEPVVELIKPLLHPRGQHHKKAPKSDSQA
jgi:hypothetical protein